MARLGAAVVVVHAGDLAWRAAIDAALRAAGLRTRRSSRSAELVKSLADGIARALVVGPAPADASMARAAKAHCPTIYADPSDSATDIVRRTLDQVAAFEASPVTSSA